MTVAHLDAPLNQQQLNPAELSGAVRRLLGNPDARVLDCREEPVDYAYGSPNTAGLHLLRGRAEVDDSVKDWSLFLKVLRHYRHWPLFDVLPADLREEALRSPAWRYEADVYASGLEGVLPVGMRLPRVLLIKELPDDRLVLVLQNVRWDRNGWQISRYRRVAELLGRLAARLTQFDALPATASRVPGVVTRRFYTGRVEVAALPALGADQLWAHPLLAGRDPQLRRDLFELARRAPAIVDHLEQLPQALIHGDASPQNLLVELSADQEVVAIDWSLGGLAAVGDDLGQLLIGLAHAGSLPLDRLPAIRSAIVTSYAAGANDEGMATDETAVRQGLDGGLIVRNAFTALPLERLAEPPSDELAQLVSARLQLTRYLVDVGLELQF